MARRTPPSSDTAQLSLELAVTPTAELAPSSLHPALPPALHPDPHPVLPPDPLARTIALASGPCQYRLRRSRRRSIGFQIDDRGLTVSAPRWVSLREIEAALVEKERWIRSRLEQWRDWRAKRHLPKVEFADGGRIPYLGGEVVLRMRPDLRESEFAAVPGALSELRLALPTGTDVTRVRDAVQAWLKAEARRVLQERLDVLGARSAAPCRSWALSSARSQWGSCTAQGRIRLNWRLVHFAPGMIDYVVAHELAHLKELNHGPRFWEQVARLLPGFETARDQIRGQDIASLPI
jgi:predicted metal-dependent hydrolase